MATQYIFDVVVNGSQLIRVSGLTGNDTFATLKQRLTQACAAASPPVTLPAAYYVCKMSGPLTKYPDTDPISKLGLPVPATTRAIKLTAIQEAIGGQSS